MSKAGIGQKEQNRTVYTMIDVTKLIMAYCVLAIHTRVPVNAEYPLIIHYLINLAVPFFFITSGFLIAKGINNTSHQKQSKAYAKKSLKFLKLFLIWAAIYLPCSFFYYLTRSNEPWWHDVASYVKRLITSGDLPYAWAIWYLHAAFVALLIIALLKRIKFSDIAIWLLGTALLLFSCVYNSQTWPTSVVSAVNAYDLVFNTFRNGFFWGIAFISTGIITSRIPKTVHPLLGLLMIIAGYAMIYANIPLSQLVGAWGLFLLAKGIDEKHPITIDLPLRKMSSAIYFIHMYFVVCLILLIAQGHSFTLFQAWLAVSIIATAVSALIVFLMKKQQFTWLKKIF